MPTNSLKLLFILILSISCSHSMDRNTKNRFSDDAQLSEFKYPFPTQKFKFTSQRLNLQMTYGDLGNKQSKKVVVLLHGKNFAGFYWDQIAKDLVKNNYRVIIPDQIGFGKSSKPGHYQYSFHQLAHNTKLLLENLGIQKHEVVGHSMGGMLAVHLSFQNPQVSKLVLVNPIGLENYLSYVEFKDPEFFYKMEINKNLDSVRNYQKKNYYDGKWNENYEKLLAPFKAWKNGPDYNIVAWNAALTYGPIFNEEILSKLEKIDIPSYLILGTRDRTGPGRGWKKEGITRKLGQYQTLGKTIKKKNAKIKLVELSGLGHMPQFENYERFSKVFFPIFED